MQSPILRRGVNGAHFAEYDIAVVALDEGVGAVVIVETTEALANFDG